MEEKGKEIVINPGINSAKEKRAVVDVTNWSPLINRLLLSYFIKGYDEVEVHYSKPEQVERLQKEVITMEFLGWEVIRQSPRIMVVKDLTVGEMGNFDETVKRLLFMIENMTSELIEFLEKKHDTGVIQSDKVINRFAYYCLRMLNKNGYKNHEKTPQVYSIITLIEETGDLIKDLAKKKFKVTKEDLSALREIKSSLGVFKELFFNFNKDGAINMANNYEKIKRTISSKSEVDSYLYAINGNIIRMNNELLVMNV